MFEAKKFSDIFDQMRAHADGVLTDFEAGSVTRTLTEAFAYELGLLYEKMRLVYLSGFVDTAEGSQLDNVVAVLGVQRGLPDFAEGKVVLTRDPGNNDILVPPATIVSTEETPENPKKNYQTVEALLITKDQTDGEVRIKAIERGEQQNADAGTIVVLPRPIPGIKSVTNAAEVKLSGKKRETDDELRRRAKNTLLAAGKATTFAIENALVQLPKVRNVKVKEDFGNVANYGVIDVYIDHPDFTKKEDPVYTDFANTIDTVRAAGILPRIWPSPLARIDATFKIKPTQASLSDKEMNELETKTAEAIQSYIESIAIDELLSVSKMVKQLLVTDGVDSLENYRMELVIPQPDQTEVLAVKTFSDTADIESPENGRFSVDRLQVFAGVKTIRVEAHAQLPAGVDLNSKQYSQDQNNPANGPVSIQKIDLAGLLVTSPALTNPQKQTVANSMTLLVQPWQNPAETSISDGVEIHYAEKAQFQVILYSHVLTITGAFLIEFPPGTPLATVADAKTKAAQNLERFFATLAPPAQDRIITFDEMTEAGQADLGFSMKIGQQADFSTTLDDIPVTDRVSSKGVLLKQEEKAKVTITIT